MILDTKTSDGSSASASSASSPGRSSDAQRSADATFRRRSIIAAAALTATIATLYLIAAVPAAAKDLGTHGKLFSIAEPDILATIEARLQALDEAGEIDRLNRDFRDRAVANVKRPPPVAGIYETQEERSWFYDPTIILDHNLTDHQGRLIHASGTRINPLEITGLTQKILFIDGDDSRQVSWAMAERIRAGRAKIVLVSGAPLELMETHRVPFFFDQRGLLTTRFEITQVPAIVEQAGSVLRISEVKL